MTKPEWGSKRTCLNCGTRFYDMQRAPIICPKCGSENASDAVSKARRVMKKAPAHVPEPKAKVANLQVGEDDGAIDGDDDTDDSLIDDTEDLAEDDMSEVIHLGPGGED